MKNTNISKILTVALVMLAGFLCGFFIDSAIFNISSVYCGVIEALLLGGTYLLIQTKENK